MLKIQEIKPSMKENDNNRLKAVDFFSGGGGMSYGLQLAGIDVLSGIDNDKNAKETYEANIGYGKFIHADVFELREDELKEKLSLEKNDKNLVLIGCSPCQFWSIIKTDKKKSEKSKNLLNEFHRFVQYFMPGYVIVENVPGVLHKKKESGLEYFINWLKEKGYHVHSGIHNTVDYGVPQSRRRYTLVANRVTPQKIFPEPSRERHLTVRDFIGVHNGFTRIKAGNKDSTDFMHKTSSMSELNLERIKNVSKDGGDRFGFASNPALQLECFVGKDDSFRDTYGRLWWDKPSPTITTKFYSISNGRFVHPEENRALSLREGAVLQSFPRNYIFKGKSIRAIARLIGNAVPPEYARRIGEAIIKSNSSKQ